MSSDGILSLLVRLQSGELDVQTVHDRLRDSGQTGFELADRAQTGIERPTEVTPDAHVDLDRARRCGFPEVVFCEGKTTQSIIDIFTAQSQAGQDCFGTRVASEQVAGILRQFPNAHHNAVSRTVSLSNDERKLMTGRVAVITAGTSDRPVAEEAVETLKWMKVHVNLIQDVGVAGPHRLQANMDEFINADAVVVVAGMEGALPSIVGGYVDVPVIGVPTSVGYGASFGGIAALLGMLNSCASNVTVVNIDAGFKASYVAGMIARRAGELRKPQI